KTAIGATESVTWEHVKSTTELVERLKKDGYQIIGVEQAEQSVMLNEFKAEKEQRYALIFGNEVKGVANEVMEQLDVCLEVPQFGTKHSLNISVCVGVVTWELLRQINS
ncbi:MAG: TrmH family RNA methyltransferase, partial [Saprospiraceae bacterium]